MPTSGAPTIAEPRAEAAQVPHHLTRELLDWATQALTAVLSTPEVQPRARQRAALTDALKQLDHLWPYAAGKEQHDIA